MMTKNIASQNNLALSEFDILIYSRLAAGQPRPTNYDRGKFFFTRILQHPYQNSEFFKFQILECISFFTRILRHPYQNSGFFFFHQNFTASVPKLQGFQISDTYLSAYLFLPEF